LLPYNYLPHSCAAAHLFTCRACGLPHSCCLPCRAAAHHLHHTWQHLRLQRFAGLHTGTYTACCLLPPRGRGTRLGGTMTRAACTLPHCVPAPVERRLPEQRDLTAGWRHVYAAHLPVTYYVPAGRHGSGLALATTHSPRAPPRMQRLPHRNALTDRSNVRYIGCGGWVRATLDERRLFLMHQPGVAAGSCADIYHICVISFIPFIAIFCSFSFFTYRPPKTDVDNMTEQQPLCYRRVNIPHLVVLFYTPPTAPPICRCVRNKYASPCPYLRQCLPT